MLDGGGPHTIGKGRGAMVDLKVLIIDVDETMRQAIRSMLQGHGEVEVAGEARDSVTGRRLATERRPDVVLVELGEHAEDAFAFAEWLRVEQPDSAVVMTAAQIRPEVMRRAMRAGAQDLISRPLDPCQLQQALEHALQQKVLRLKAQGARGQVSAVLGVSGGVGTTTIATNVAAAMAAAGDLGPIVLIDFDFDMGSVPCFLDVAPERTYLDLRRATEGLDADGLRQFMPRHKSGLFMLAGPQKLEELEEILPEDIGKVLNLCRSAFRQVVVDAGHGLDERRIEVLDRADRILLVTQLNVAALRNARRVLDLLGRLGYQDGRIKLVANRVSKGEGVTPDDVERSLGQKLDFQVVNDYPSAIDAIDTGVPIVEGKRKSRAASDLTAMARAIAASAPIVHSGGRATGAQAAWSAGQAAAAPAAHRADAPGEAREERAGGIRRIISGLGPTGTRGRE
jgi:pilus assembly protein CpaE